MKRTAIDHRARLGRRGAGDTLTLYATEANSAFA